LQAPQLANLDRGPEPQHGEANGPEAEVLFCPERANEDPCMREIEVMPVLNLLRTSVYECSGV